MQGKTTINFTNGALTKIRLEKPSEVLAFVGVPVQIARIIFAIPLAGLQQDTAMINAQTSKLNAEQQALNAQAALLKLQTQQVGKAIVATPAQ